MHFNGAMSSPKTIVLIYPPQKKLPHLYADDTQISTSAKTIEELTENLNNDLKKIGEWLARNKL